VPNTRQPNPRSAVREAPAIRGLLEALAAAPRHAGVFNPWYEEDPAHDLGAQSPSLRRANLSGFLAARLGRAGFLLVGEAPSYQGGRFTGIPMSSERILLGHKRADGIPPEVLLAGGRRSSRPEVRPTGFTEPTASIVWKAVVDLGLDPRRVVTWNTFPWHTYRTEKGVLSNRTPTPAEVAAGAPILRDALALFPQARVVAVGRTAERGLAALGVEATAVRHPANGGAGRFRAQLEALVRGR
jgi:hypothetical protein